MVSGPLEFALDLSAVFQRLRRALDLRAKYTPCWVASPPDAPELPPLGELRTEFRAGLAHIVHHPGDAVVLGPDRSVEEFYTDMAELFNIRSDGSVGTFCFHRLKLLQTKFDLYIMANYDLELEEQIVNSHRDFYNVRKVDTHVHHSAAMNAKHLLRFIKKKVRHHGSDVVVSRNGTPVTLAKLFGDLGFSWFDLCLDKMNVTADQTVFHRFDRFNQKYNPLNQPELRTVFLKTDNEMKGRYLAEITRELLDDLEESKYQHTEWRLSIYGRHRREWESLSEWVLLYNLISPNNRWMIQVPRLYNAYHASGQLSCFQDMLDNIFIPMFEATLEPEKHPKIAEFLRQVSGFDSVDDESKSNEPNDRSFSSHVYAPSQWRFNANPSYKYYNFYLQSNLKVLNKLRARLGLNTFDYRPHAGEAGELHHLDTAFLLADGIAHGLNLRKNGPLQYLYFLCRIPIAMSPCSNNNLFLSYQKTPFHEFFQRGLNVSLSTDDPLMFHQTKEPLMEEYSLAKQFFRLSSADLCELARNSVLQSGFPAEQKAAWIGSAAFGENHILRTNVPDVRVSYRKQCVADELALIKCEGEDTMKAFRAGIPRTIRHDDEAPKKERRLQLKRHLSVPNTLPELADCVEQVESRPAHSPHLNFAAQRQPSPKKTRTGSETSVTLSPKSASVSPLLIPMPAA